MERSESETTPNDASSRRKNTWKRNRTLKERNLNNAPDKEFIINEIVLATVPGYKPWPARIIEIDGQTIRVEFFGTGERFYL